MTAETLADFRCPACERPLRIEAVSASAAGRDIEEGMLHCLRCGGRFPIERGLPRFVAGDNYAGNFGFEWNRHVRTQVDSFSGTSISRERFFCASGWPDDLSGERVLEAGCGSGRFTQVALATGATVFSFDYSNAVDANREVNGRAPRLRLCQADIYRIPFERESFDRVFCFGVLQHCPNPKTAFENLLGYVRPGGHLAVDIYHSKPRDWINPAVWLRAITPHLSNERLYRMAERVVPVLLPLKVWVTERVPFGRIPAFFIPIVSHRGVIAGADRLTWPQLIEWSILDTFDHYSPRYDRGQRLSTMRRWFEASGLRDIHVSYGPNGIIGRGIKPR